MDERTEDEVSSLSADIMVLQMVFVAMTRAMLRSRAVDESTVARHSPRPPSWLAHCRNRSDVPITPATTSGQCTFWQSCRQRR
jgi:hypothetical protein